MGVVGMVECMGDIVGNWGFRFVFGFGAGFSSWGFCVKGKPLPVLAWGWYLVALGYGVGVVEYGSCDLYGLGNEFPTV